MTTMAAIGTTSAAAVLAPIRGNALEPVGGDIACTDEAGGSWRPSAIGDVWFLGVRSS